MGDKVSRDGVVLQGLGWVVLQAVACRAGMGSTAGSEAVACGAGMGSTAGSGLQGWVG